MVELRVEGEENEFVVDLPEHVDERTRDIIEKTLKKCVEPENEDRAMQALNKVLSQTNAIVDELKEDGKYHEKIEKDLRKFVGIHMKKGFDVGRKTIQPKEVEVVQEAATEKMIYEGEVIEDLPENLQDYAKFMFACLELGRISLETGFILGILISVDKADKFYEEEADGISYIR